jgi:F-type H+-transporting ATPase subunit epsilon
MATKQIQLVLVTPETTLLDEPVTSLRFPLFDGQIGILPSRAPLVGRLGTGELQLHTAAGTRSYFIDGGFVQVKGSVVSLLTNGAIAAGSLDARAAEEELQAIQRRVPRSDAELTARLTDQGRARRKLAMARRAR